MNSQASKQIRCAIYTRKSTEHGLDLAFNSLDAQREACESYVKSQASQGWICLSTGYDDAAYSGGNLDRPALKALLKDIEAGLVDVIVVYKIDRLTRSLADFAKLVELFDAKSVSFVAVTQQFNTTSSMGRLTLNVLLSFAQFERELSSERVRDKVAASRAKGKWTGGTPPLGYDAKDKRLVVNDAEANTVRTIFDLYLKTGGFQELICELDQRGIVTKRRQTKLKKYQGGIRFSYGPLGYLLKNRVYLGEMGYRGKWYPGEHEPIIDTETFDKVQALLSANAISRKSTRTRSGALLLGKIFDDAGNVMSPSYSTKKGVRYRFYVSSALLRGRKKDCGSIGRISAIPTEKAISDAMRQRFDALLPDNEGFGAFVSRTLRRVVVHNDRLRLTICDGDHISETLDILWSAQTPRAPAERQQLESHQPDGTLVNLVVRAHAWLRQLNAGTYRTVEALAKDAGLHPKIVRQSIRLAFLEPALTEAVLVGDRRFAARISSLKGNPPLAWACVE